MTKRMLWKLPFQREGKFPIDIDSVFSSKNDAEEYVVNPDSSAHVGQIIAVTGGSETIYYKINETGVSSGLTDFFSGVYNKEEVDNLISTAGKVKDVKVGEETVVDENGVAIITLPTVDKDLNDSSVNAVQNKTITNKFNDYYNKEEVDNKFSKIELFEFVDELPQSGKTNLIYVTPNTASNAEQNKYIEYIYKIDGTWEKVGEFKADTNLEDCYTKEESDNKYQPKGEYLTGITIDDSLDKNSENPVKNKVVFEEFSKVREEISGATGTDLSGYVRKDELKTVNGHTLTSDTKSNIEVGTIRDIKVNGTSVVTGTTANIVLSGYVPVDAYNALLARVVALENFMSGSTFITTSNIADHAVTSIESTDSDIFVKGNKGDVTITLNGISNIAYNDTTE